MFKYLSLLCAALFFAGCSNSAKPVKFKDGRAIPTYSGSATLIAREPYTNVVKLVRPAETNKVIVKIPAAVSKPIGPTNSNKPITLTSTGQISTAPVEEIILTVIIPEQTNTVVMSGIIEPAKRKLTVGAIFLYYFLVAIFLLIGFYIWSQRKVKKTKETKIKVSAPTTSQ